ncbi:MAG: hypothetical protein J5862_00295 [Bacteroidales bacterium]|nr:hypothetical protein [Bacteroidales bacterium]
MRKIFFKTFFYLIAMTMFLIGNSAIFAQNDNNNERYNLAVYATGTQNNQPLPISLQNVIQNRTITKLTAEGNYRLIERSSEFLKQIQNEQSIQQSGDVADGQIAELGASYGAQKICVVSVSIIDKYLYIATRIVDVVTKTSFESADAEIDNYNSIPLLTKTLETTLTKMLANNGQISAPAKQQKMDNKPSKADPNHVKPAEISANNSKSDYDNYKTRLKKEKGGFLDMNSMAYQEYAKYHKNVVSGGTCLGIGIPVFVGGLTTFSIGGVGLDEGSTDGETVGLITAGTIAMSGGLTLLIVGAVKLNKLNDHLQKSYQYYINGEKQTATINFQPYFGGNNTFGAGISLRF